MATRIDVVVEGSGGELDRFEVPAGKSPAEVLSSRLMRTLADLTVGDVIRVVEVEEGEDR